MSTSTRRAEDAAGELAFLNGGGETGRLIAARDWSATSLGPVRGWPASRKAAIALILQARVPITTLWNGDGVMIYNDAYAEVAGGRHPGLLGAPVREGWPEVAAFNDNVMKVGLAGGTLAYRDEEMTLHRNGAPERVWMNLDYSPLFDESGTPVGVMAIVVETTAKVRAERRLHDDQARLTELFQQAPGLMAILDGPEHVFRLANAAYLDLIGRDDVIGKPLRDVLPEVVQQGFVTLLDEATLSGEPFVGRAVPITLERAAGMPPEERFLDFVYQPIRDTDDEIVGVFVQGHDVTEQQRAVQALRESEERFRLVAETAPVMLWMGDTAGSCVYLNAAQRAFWGVATERIAGFDWSETTHPEDAAALAGPFSEAMRAHTPFSVEIRLRRADGIYRSILTTAHPRFGPGGAFLGMIGVNVDVTELRDTEDAIREESQRLAILNRIGAAIGAEVEVERVVQLVSDACVELIGASYGAFFYNVVGDGEESYTLYTLSGAPREAFADFPMPRATAVFQPTFRGEGIVRSDDILADPRYGLSEPWRGMPKGHLPVRSYLAVPVASRSGVVLGGLFFAHATPGMFTPRHEEIVAGIAGQAAIAIDRARLYEEAERELAERRRAEAALQALNETLEQRVVDAIAERLAAEEALRQAQKLEAIGKLTGGVAHDFNNLLQVISGNLQLLARDVAGNDRAADRVGDALDGVHKGAKLARQLLAFSRRQPLEPKVVSVARLVTGMGELLRRTLGENIEVETMASAGLWNTFVDPAQLETAVLNLALNARDAMGTTGALTIEVGNAFLDDAYARGHSDVRPGQYVMLGVTDTGVGIPRDDLERVFEPFFSTKPQGKGTGLGLSMVYGFVKQSGGHVKIYSEPGSGTTVRLYLPRVDQAEDAPVVLDTGPVVGGSETILVAEDDDAVRATVAELLSDLGYRVLTARDATSALSVVESGVPVDLLFTDVVMPGKLRSAELARTARERQPGLAVLFTSGYTENSIVHGGRLDAGLDLLSKPYTREQLARKLRQMLGRSATAGELPAPAPAAAPTVVLVVEDEPLIRMTTVDMLQEAGMTVREAGSAAAALAALAAEDIGLCIVDVGLPDMSGVALAARIRERRPDMPLLFATGHARLPEAEGLGNVAVLAKPYDEAQLRAAIARLIAAPGW
jgi:PAS domain S-box-containing protein